MTNSNTDFSESISELNLYQKGLLAVLFAVFIVIGINIAGDYGVPWDDKLQTAVGKQNLDLALNGDKSIYQSHDKYYGSAFETPLFFIQSFGKSYKTQIYIRHLVTHLYFLFALFIFFKLLLKLFKSYYLSIIGVLFIYLSPRIFAHSFFNTKDIAFMSAFIISIYTMLRMIDEPNNKRIIIHALASAFLIDIRIIGILITVITFSIAIMKKLFCNSKTFNSIALIKYSVFSIIFIFIFWPSLWFDPLLFVKSIFRMANFPWRYTNLFDGIFINANEIPWYYIPTWIGITTPFFIITLYITGSLSLFKNIIKSHNNTISSNNIVFLTLIFIPFDLWLLFVIISSVFYDGWRHLFFFYPLIVIGAIYGINFLNRLLKTNTKKTIFIGIIVVFIILSAKNIIKLHPYQQTYFNNIVSHDNNSIRQNWEQDYWGLCYKEGFEKIYNLNSKSIIRVYVANIPGINNSKLVDENNSKFVLVDSLSKADYFITNYRFHPREYNYEKIDSIYKQGSCILGIYKLNNK